MPKNIDLILNRLRSKQSTDSNINIGINPVQSQKEIPIGQYTVPLNAGVLSIDERNNTQRVRYGGTIQPIFSNLLFNYSGDNSFLAASDLRIYDPIKNNYFYDYDDIISNENGWYYYTNIDSCNKTMFEPIKNRFNLQTEWKFILTYPSKQDYKTLFFNDIPLSKGIAVRRGRFVTVDELKFLRIETYINHSLQVGDIISIESDSFTGLEGDFTVARIGDENGNDKNNTFLIQRTSFTFVFSLTKKLRIRKKVNRGYCSYYSRWFERIADPNKMDIVQNGFARTIYGDLNYNIIGNETIDLTTLRDNLNRPISELYLTAVKYNKGDFFTPNQQGISIDYENEYSIRTINTVNKEGVDNNVTPFQQYYFGDIVCYNPDTLSETIIEKSFSRFNTKNREDNNFFEGYIHQTHYKMTYREYSSFVSNSKQSVNIPDYALLDDDGLLRWRDLVKMDFNVKKPAFLNNAHYLYENIMLILSRQYNCATVFMGNPSYINIDCNDYEIQHKEEVQIDVC